MTTKLVTIGLPVYKRLEYLPRILDVIGSQDYPNIELVVSDNGMNGSVVQEAINKHYRRTARFRQNPSTVGMSIHFNQIIQSASGDYFSLLADDDEISSNYVSDLVSLLERNPRATVAIGVQETMNESGEIVKRSSENVPEILSGTDFIRAAWSTHEYRFESFSTFLARTANLKACGGFPDFWKGSGNDDALVVKLCLDNFVALSTRCSFKKRFYDTSFGYALTTEDLARGIRDLLTFLDTDPAILSFAQNDPSKWSESKRILVDVAWNTYYSRWANMYRKRMPVWQWVKAGFELPLFPKYYKPVSRMFFAVARSIVWNEVKLNLTRAYATLQRRPR